MRRFGFIIAAVLLTGLFSGGVTELAERFGIEVWFNTKAESAEISDLRLQAKANNPDR